MSSSISERFNKIYNIIHRIEHASKKTENYDNASLTSLRAISTIARVKKIYKEKISDWNTFNKMIDDLNLIYENSENTTIDNILKGFIRHLNEVDKEIIETKGTITNETIVLNSPSPTRSPTNLLEDRRSDGDNSPAQSDSSDPDISNMFQAFEVDPEEIDSGAAHDIPLPPSPTGGSAPLEPGSDDEDIADMFQAFEADPEKPNGEEETGSNSLPSNAAPTHTEMPMTLYNPSDFTLSNPGTYGSAAKSDKNITPLSASLTQGRVPNYEDRKILDMFQMSEFEPIEIARFPKPEDIQKHPYKTYVDDPIHHIDAVSKPKLISRLENEIIDLIKDNSPVELSESLKSLSEEVMEDIKGIIKAENKKTVNIIVDEFDPSNIINKAYFTPQSFKFGYHYPNWKKIEIAIKIISPLINDIIARLPRSVSSGDSLNIPEDDYYKCLLAAWIAYGKAHRIEEELMKNEKETLGVGAKRTRGPSNPIKRKRVRGTTASSSSRKGRPSRGKLGKSKKL